VVVVGVLLQEPAEEASDKICDAIEQLTFADRHVLYPTVP